MPTNLGALPTNLPFTNGKVQIKRGAVDASVTVTNANNGHWITDGTGNPMTLVYTPRYPCFWVVHSNVMSHGVADGVGWRRWDHNIYLAPADANGIQYGVQAPAEVYDQTTIEWTTRAASAVFRLSAGVTYTVGLMTGYTSAGSVRYHTGPAWLRIIGRIVGEGTV
jgi:hypothetical protein